VLILPAWLSTRERFDKKNENLCFLKVKRNKVITSLLNAEKVQSISLKIARFKYGKIKNNLIASK
jgi:hypothetical protein